MNDMAHEPKESALDIYTDESTRGTVGDTIEILNNKLCADMVQIGEWCTDNKMVLNRDKTKAMIITTYQRYCDILHEYICIWRSVRSFLLFGLI